MSLQEEVLAVKAAGLNDLSVLRLRRIYKRITSCCYKPTAHAYSNYGGRGITVCKEWLESRLLFITWALSHGYSDTLTIERKDVDGAYEPDNCSWIPRSEQPRNRRNTVRVQYDGRLMDLQELSKITGVPLGRLRKRIYTYKMPIERAVTAGKVNSWKHGTRAGYELHKCRCELCTESNKLRGREIRARKKLKSSEERGNEHQCV